MKTFSVAVAVAVVLTFICLQESSAVPVTEESSAVPVTEDQELEEPVNYEYQEMPVESWTMPYNNREKRSSRRCRFCCGCCPNMIGCGTCCRF